MFSALRQGAPLYILDKGDEPNMKIGQIEGVTQPRFNPASGFGSTVVDIAVKIGNEKKDFIGVPSNSSVHSYGNFVISENKELMAQEVNAMLQTSKSIIDNIDYHKRVISTCEEILKQVDPDYAKQQLRDEEINSIKEEVSSLKEDISKVLDLLTKAKDA